jgi:hypothetical protein
MKKLILSLAVASMFIAGALFADVPLNNTHKNLKKDGESINCAYCHTKAAIPKKGKDYKQFQSGASCKGQGCH